jgi:hypothetical protein
MVNVSKMATVQQQSLASDISNLATKFVADPTTIDVASLQNVRFRMYRPHRFC